MTSVSRLVEAARVATGLQDFGDGGFREGLEILVASAEREAQLHDRGKATFASQVVQFLSNRLQVEYWYRRHPEIDDEEIVKPLIGLGLPRTGTTALSCLLAEDPATRSIRLWESLHPCPPPEASGIASDPRIAMTERALELHHHDRPRLQTMFPVTATSPTECQTFMAFDFKSQVFQASFNVPSYVQWLNHRADLLSTYQYVKRVLKLLQWHCPPKRWRLKNPSHSLFIEALSSVFPDALFWMTHRDVAKVIPSVADLYFEMQKASSDTVDKHAIGRMTSDFCELGMRRMMEFRDGGNNHRFFDAGFADCQRDPFPVVENLYAFLGEELTSEARSRMQAWRLRTPRDKHGDHRYEPTDFGLDIPALRQRFDFYLKRYSVERVSPG